MRGVDYDRMSNRVGTKGKNALYCWLTEITKWKTRKNNEVLRRDNKTPQRNKLTMEKKRAEQEKRLTDVLTDGLLLLVLPRITD